MTQPEQSGTSIPDALLDTPNGMFPASVDKKGRLKLPVVFQKYLRGLPDQGLFATSLDTKVGSIYPASIWRLNKALMLKGGLDRQRNGVWDNSQIYGEDTSMDAEGRVLLPTILRRELGFEDRPVRVYCNRGRIEILSEAVYEERRRKAAETAEADLAALENAGFL